MLIIKKNNSISNPLYLGLIKTSYGGQFGTNNHFFNQDGIFLPKEEATNLWNALTKRPIECDSEEEVFAIQNAVQELKICLATLNYDAVKENHGKEKSNDTHTK